MSEPSCTRLRVAAASRCLREHMLNRKKESETDLTESAANRPTSLPFEISDFGLKFRRKIRSGHKTARWREMRKSCERVHAVDSIPLPMSLAFNTRPPRSFVAARCRCRRCNLNSVYRSVHLLAVSRSVDLPLAGGSQLQTVGAPLTPRSSIPDLSSCAVPAAAAAAATAAAAA